MSSELRLNPLSFLDYIFEKYPLAHARQFMVYYATTS